jgi:hypothetical protein
MYIRKQFQLIRCAETMNRGLRLAPIYRNSSNKVKNSFSWLSSLQSINCLRLVLRTVLVEGTSDATGLISTVIVIFEISYHGPAVAVGVGHSEPCNIVNLLLSNGNTRLAHPEKS